MWEEDNFHNAVQHKLLECSHVINVFEESAKFRLARMGEKLTKLERYMIFVESRLSREPAQFDGA